MPGNLKGEKGILHALMPGASIQQNRKVLVSISTSNEILVFNVGGTRFETYVSTIHRHPNTKLIDEKFLKRYWREDKHEYFFDHDPEVFKYILQYLRTGELHLPSSQCGASLKSELDFWGVEEADIEDCCWLNYNSWSQTLDSLKRLEHDRKITMGTSYYIRPDEKGTWPKIRNYGWEFLNNPNWSLGSKIYGAISILMVFLSIFAFVSHTHEFFQVEQDDVDDLTLDGDNGVNSTETTSPITTTTTESAFPHWGKKTVHSGLNIIDAVCFAYFVTEIIVRFIFCPRKLRFFLRPMNIIDFLALVPDVVAYLYVLFESDQDTESVLLIFVSLLRIVRVFRIFRLMRHFPGLWTLVYTIKASVNELFLMFLFLIIGMIVFSSLIYYAEERSNFPSIPRAFWWAIITMTTVGYGDMYPVTNLGYLVGSMTAVSGLLLIGFIVPVLVNNFILYYNHTECALEREKRRKQRLAREKRKTRFRKLMAERNSSVEVVSTTPSPTSSVSPTLTIDCNANSCSV